MTQKLSHWCNSEGTRARVPHPNYAHVYTGWSVQSCSFPDGVTPSHVSSHSLLSTIMSHSIHHLRPFKCIAYRCKRSSSWPYQTVPAFRQACPLTVAPGKIKKPRLRFPNCKVKRPPQLHTGASHTCKACSLKVSFSCRSCSAAAFAEACCASLDNSRSKKHKCQLNHNCRIMMEEIQVTKPML